MTRYVIIGGSAGAVGAVEAIRHVDPAGDIAVINEELYPTYSRPMIADYLSGEADAGKMLFPSKDFWEKHRVQPISGKRAIKLDLSRKSVELEGAERIAFDRLLIATGSKPFIPKMEGTGRKGVYGFTSMSDAQRIDEAIGNARKAVVIGGGLIGVSATEALVRRGLRVTIVELKNWILNLILDQQAAGIVETVMRKRGVSIVAGRTVKRIIGRKENDEAVGGVVLDDGTEIECDAVIVAVGVIPRTELAAGTDLKVNKGILVDKLMQTSLPDVYACGDVAEVYDFVRRTNRVLALWPAARIGGRVAGYNMAGQKREYSDGTSMSALNYFEVPVASIGLTTPDETDGCETLLTHDESAGTYRKIVVKNGKIVGLVMVGDIGNAGLLFSLMKIQAEVGSFKQKLTADTFSLASLPVTLRNQLLSGV